jgi:hypothetical protein
MKKTFGNKPNTVKLKCKNNNIYSSYFKETGCNLLFAKNCSEFTTIKCQFLQTVVIIHWLVHVYDLNFV